MTKKTHGLSKHPLYNVWNSMKQRCYNTNNPEYKNWGGRGIIVCDEWKDDFLSFYNFAIKIWEKGLIMDREDNDGNYIPDNVRFVTWEISNNNKRDRCYEFYKAIKDGFFGVYCENDKWEARCGCHIGYYSTAEEAVVARNNYIIEHELEHKHKIQSVY